MENKKEINEMLCNCKSINDGVTKGIHSGCKKPLTKFQPNITQETKQIETMAYKKQKAFRYNGSGEHSVFELELICEQQIELSNLKELKIQSQQERIEELEGEVSSYKKELQETLTEWDKFQKENQKLKKENGELKAELKRYKRKDCFNCKSTNLRHYDTYTECTKCKSVM